MAPKEARQSASSRDLRETGLKSECGSITVTFTSFVSVRAEQRTRLRSHSVVEVWRVRAKSAASESAAGSGFVLYHHQ